jgi:alkylmercury lyase
MPIEDVFVTSLQRRAFRMLLADRHPVGLAELADDLQLDAGAVAAGVDDMAARGALRQDDQGRIVGAAGLSVVPDRHQLLLGGEPLWTWCAYDAIGILGGLGVSGTIISTSPSSGSTIEVRVTDGHPEPCSTVLFLAADTCCANTYEQWCPQVNFFEDQTAAEVWATQTDAAGRILSLEEASQLGASDWAPLTSTPPAS